MTKFFGALIVALSLAIAAVSLYVAAQSTGVVGSDTVCLDPIQVRDSALIVVPELEHLTNKTRSIFEAASRFSVDSSDEQYASISYDIQWSAESASYNLHQLAAYSSDPAFGNLVVRISSHQAAIRQVGLQLASALDRRDFPSVQDAFEDLEELHQKGSFLAPSMHRLNQLLIACGLTQ